MIQYRKTTNISHVTDTISVLSCRCR